jgi:hypothetical protein
MRSFPLLIAIACLPWPADAADVYRCVDKGVTTYQDFPCRTPESGKSVRVIVPETPPPRAASADDLQELRKRVDAMTRERRQREITSEIDGLERVLTRLAGEEAAELDVLRNRRLYASANIPGEPLERGRVDRALADEMSAVSARYRERAEAARRRIVELRNEQKALAPPPPPQ